jgi:hypothetical protein
MSGPERFEREKEEAERNLKWRKRAQQARKVRRA